MAEKINVKCTECNGKFRAMCDQIEQIECPECGGKIVSDSKGKKPPSNEEKIKTKSKINTKNDDSEGLKELRAAHKNILTELEKAIVGQKDVIEQIIVAIVTGGHCLLEGVPGLAKTLLISSLADALSLSFHRIQFTPDLMPSDITGTDLIQDDPETGERKFKFLQGPIFSNIILADEINRTPPKTQAAMLEAMQEKQVSIGETVHKLQKPFFVLATQNPLDQEGTYPLPEAQQDRFLFKIIVDYPSDKEEKQIVRRVSEKQFGKISSVLSGDDILEAQKLAVKIPVADTVIDYAAKLVRSTRINTKDALDFMNRWVSWGCGPRASIYLISAAKAYAALRGADCVSCEDVAHIAKPVMRHRLGLNYTARAEGISSDDVIEKLLKAVEKY